MAYAEDFSDEDPPRFARMREDAEKGRYQETLSWPDPVPLPEGLSPVQPFDGALLPDKVAPWVLDISERLQCPPDYVAIAAMVALGAVLGRKIGVKPQRKTDWYEVPNLWGCAVGRPGSLKTPAIEEALKPLRHLELEAREANEAARKDYERGNLGLEAPQGSGRVREKNPTQEGSQQPGRAVRRAGARGADATSLHHERHDL